MISERLQQQIAFITELDKVKQIYRQNYLMDGSRQENDAEHSWHIAIMAFLLQEYVVEPVDLPKVMKMTLLHDVVEVYAGDTFCYDEEANLGKDVREKEAAERLYGLLPADQRDEYRSLWEEFEERRTPEAKFAACLDRLQPMIQNYRANGGTWVKYNVPSSKVKARGGPVADAAPALGDYLQSLIEDAIKQGFLKE